MLSPWQSPFGKHYEGAGVTKRSSITLIAAFSIALRFIRHCTGNIECSAQ